MLKVVSSTHRNSKDQFVPLKNVSVQVNIHSFAAEVCIKQLFINSEETLNPIEAVYCFPVEEQAAIYSFEANLDDGRKIQAQIKEKKSAQCEYCKALEQGHGAFLLEQNEKSNDIFTISIGSLKPQSKCEIEIHYVQELELINDGQRIQYVLPTIIAPRYSSKSDGVGHIKSPGSTTSNYVQSAPYTISFICSISSLPIASVGSPSHPIQITTVSSNDEYPTMNVSLAQENTHLDRDIILNIDLKEQQSLTYALVEKQAIMISFVPTLELCHNNNKIGKINCEYIFVVDCSGSMSDDNKIGYAQQAMSIFLKSLPIGSYFNIIRFGSSYQQFENKNITIEYNEKNANKAHDYIKRMKADLGGTELYSVLSHIHKEPPNTNYSRQLFILTDGEIDDVDKVLRLCRSMSNTTRIFSFGLGSAPSRSLVKGLARVTNGSYLFIPPNTHVDVAVARQLDKVLESCLTNIKIQCHFNNNEYENYRISPKNIPPIYAKQRLNVYVMLPKNIKEKLSGSIEFLTSTDNLLERVTFTETEPSSSLIATRLAAKSIINDLQMEDYNLKSSHQARFIEQQKEYKKQELIDISIQHQILSPFTAFIGIETCTKQEIMAAASSGEIILREVPIEIRSNTNTLDDSKDCTLISSVCYQQNFFEDDEYCVEADDDDTVDESGEDEGDFDEDEDDEDAFDEGEEDEDVVDEGDQINYRNSKRKSYLEIETKAKSNPHLYSKLLETREARQKSRSRSPIQRRRSSDSMQNQNVGNQIDIIRQIIGLQNFNGLWSINNLEQIIKLLEKSLPTSIFKNIDFKKILNDHKHKDNDVVLSMIIMFICMKYFTDDELLWKPIMKKCSEVMKNQLGTNEYNEMLEKIKQTI
ncbi:unnamed protein product [Rotaria sp. Silwood1]|nr:unnamed protein product [Rotaria sp. Silwood1]